MKQYITPEQWGQFERANPTAAEILRNHYAGYQESVRAEQSSSGCVLIEFDPLWVWFDIGRMIEFLQGSGWLIYMNNDNRMWNIAIGWGEGDNYGRDTGNGVGISIGNDELCDTLWELIVYILTQEIVIYRRMEDYKSQ